jgi:glycine/D-amino acid oxidase-like deaminating enzyme
VSGLPAKAEVVIVGGGAIGTSIAFHLAEAGIGVCLLEREQLASGSTSRAAGGIRAQFSDPLNVAIGLRSIEAFTRFGTRPGAEIDLHQVGYLFLLDREEDAGPSGTGSAERARRSSRFVTSIGHERARPAGLLADVRPIDARANAVVRDRPGARARREHRHRVRRARSRPRTP